MDITAYQTTRQMVFLHLVHLPMILLHRKIVVILIIVLLFTGEELASAFGKTS